MKHAEQQAEHRAQANRFKGFRFNGWTLARIRGVDLRVHVSLLALLAYVVVVASLQFPYVVKQSGIDSALIDGRSWEWGLIFAFALFLSVVLHEFGHVLAAQSMGVKVKGITLMMLGGVSEMERIPEKPYAEFKMSVVGPLVSFGIAGVLWLVNRAFSSANLDFFCYWIGRVNLALGIFNLLPAFPLDGGRAFRSLLAAKYGMAHATVMSVRVAKGLAWAFGVLAILSFNLLLLLIAFFVYSAATSELTLSVSRGALRGIPAGKVGLRTAVLEGSASLSEAAQLMYETQSRVLPVKRNHEGQAGLMSSDALRAVPKSSWDTVQVSSVMTPISTVIETGASLEETIPELARAGVLPLADHGKICGVIRYRDLSDLVELQRLQVA